MQESVLQLSGDIGLIGDWIFIMKEVHQVNRTSSDLVMGLSLVASFLPPTPLTITNEPADLIVEELKPATFTVGVSGNSPRYQWFKNGNPLPGATKSSYTIASSTVPSSLSQPQTESGILSL